jgi:hypothetical protein
MYTYHFSKKTIHISNHGYVAITSVLVVTVIIITIGVSVSLLSISDLQTSFANKKSEEVVYFTEACVEEALLRLNETNDVPTSLSFPEGTCVIGPTPLGGGSWNVIVQGTKDDYTKKIEIQATRGTTVDVTSWKEIE